VTTAAPAPMNKGEIGAPQQSEAKVAYKPPVAGTGVADSQKGFDYEDKGAEWPNMYDAGDCGAGSQSPIDITRFVDLNGQTKSLLWFDYYADPTLTGDSVASLSNAGHGPFFTNPTVDLGYVKVGLTESEAFEYSFHAPAEHTIDGEVFPLELQVLHHDADGKMLGVSILFKYGDSNPFLKNFNEAVPDMPIWTVEGGSAKVAHMKGSNPAAFNLEDVLAKGQIHPGGDLTFYNYEGSLTQPPCTKGVQWYVSAEPVDASKEEIAHIHDAITSSPSTKSGNARVTQPLDGRQVLVSHTGFQHHIKMHGHKKPTPQGTHARGYNTQDTPWVAAA